MTFRESTGTLTVDGIRIDFESLNTLHGVDNPVGQLSFTVRTPLPAALTSGTGPIGKRIVVTATMASHEGIVTEGNNRVRGNLRQEASVIFSGTIRRRGFGSDPSGRTRTYACQDDLWMFGVETWEPQAWDGPILADTIIRGQLQSKGYGTSRRQPMFLDALRFPDGSSFTLGGVAAVDDGQIVLRDGSSQLALMRNIAEVPGYKLYALPTGSPRMSRVLGIPPAVGTTDLFRADGGYREISNTTEGFSFRGEDDAEDVTNYWEVFGASWTDADGTAIDIRSFPSYVLLAPDLPEDAKVRHQEFSSPFILTQTQADGARVIREEDSGARARTVTIELDGMPTAYPGHVHKLIAPDLLLGETYYVMTVVHTMDNRNGFRTTITYRRGAGTARTAGTDRCETRTLFTNPIHLGDEYVGWYAVPNPYGTERVYSFAVSEEITGLAFLAEAHGCNSQYTAKPPPANLTGSKVVFEQPLGTVIGQNELPVLDERYTERRPYGSLATLLWPPIRVGIPGTAAPGTVYVRLVAGTAGVGAADFELKNGRAMNCEKGVPRLPRYPHPPVQPPPQPTRPGTVPTTDPTAPTAPVRPARYILVQDGTATPSRPIFATRTLTVPRGATRLSVMVGASNLAAATGSRGAGWSEYFAITLRNMAGGLKTFYGQLQASGSPLAGSGLRSCSWDITADAAGGAWTLVPEQTRIVSETRTLTLTSSWDAYVTPGANGP